MEYIVKRTDVFIGWLKKVKDPKSRARLIIRTNRLKQGNFGDHKSLGGELFELRITFGPGYRIYYTVQGRQVVLLISGGDKTSQKKDISKAREILAQIKE